MREYADDPAGFARDILDVELWPRQSEIAQRLLAGQSRWQVCCSGRNFGKVHLGRVIEEMLRQGNLRFEREILFGAEGEVSPDRPDHYPHALDALLASPTCGNHEWIAAGKHRQQAEELMAAADINWDAAADINWDERPPCYDCNRPSNYAPHEEGCSYYRAPEELTEGAVVALLLGVLVGRRWPGTERVHVGVDYPAPERKDCSVSATLIPRPPCHLCGVEDSPLVPGYCDDCSAQCFHCGDPCAPAHMPGVRPCCDSCIPF